MMLLFCVRACALCARAHLLRMVTVVLSACCLVKDMFQMAIKSTSAFNAKIVTAFNGRRFDQRALQAIVISRNRFDDFWIVLDDPKSVKRCAFAKY